MKLYKNFSRFFLILIGITTVGFSIVAGIFLFIGIGRNQLTETKNIGDGLIYKFYINKNNDVIEYTGQEKNVSVIEMVEYPGHIYKKSSYQQGKNTKEIGYTLKKEGSKKLLQEFLKKGFYGPELYFMQRIFINDKDWFDSEGVLGAYLPETREMCINTETMKRSLFELENRYGETFDNEINLRTKALECMIHEYFHHIANSYPNAPYNNINQSVWNQEKTKTESWNDKFINDFKNILNYQGVNSNKKYSNNQTTKQNWKSIGIDFSARDLFNLSNTLPKKIKMEDFDFSKLLESQDFYSWSGHQVLNLSTAGYKVRPVTNFGRIFGIDKIKNGDKNKEEIFDKIINYNYSLDELFARKYLLATYEFTNEAKSLWEQWKKTEEKIYSATRSMSEYSEIATPDLFSEQSKYETVYYGYSQYLNKKSSSLPYGTETSEFLYDRFLQDAVFQYPANKSSATNYQTGKAWYEDQTNAAKELVESLSEQLGYDIGADLSLAWQKTDAVFNNSSSQGNIEILGNSQSHAIKMAGYIKNDESNFKYIGYLNDQGNFQKISSITINKVNMGYKLSTYDQNRNLMAGEKYFWVSNDYASNPALFEGKALYFAKNADGEDKKILSSVRSGNDSGDTTTYSTTNPRSRNWNLRIYKFVKEGASQGVKAKIVNETFENVYLKYRKIKTNLSHLHDESKVLRCW